MFGFILLAGGVSEGWLWQQTPWRSKIASRSSVAFAACEVEIRDRSSRTRPPHLHPDIQYNERDVWMQGRRCSGIHHAGFYGPTHVVKPRALSAAAGGTGRRNVEAGAASKVCFHVSFDFTHIHYLSDYKGQGQGYISPQYLKVTRKQNSHARCNCSLASMAVGGLSHAIAASCCSMVLICREYPFLLGLQF